MKTCNKCSIEKSKEEFHRTQNTFDGRRNTCKACILGHEPHKKALIEKVCKGCDILKPIKDFPLTNKLKIWYGTNCRPCENKRRKKRRVENPRKEKIRKFNQTNKLVGDLKITEEKYQKLIDNQNNKCAICKEELIKAHLDHDHSTGIIRELLCHNCNVGIGLFGENTEILQNAILYLEKHKNNFPDNQQLKLIY